MKKLMLAIVVLSSLSGCVVQKAQLRRPFVAARFNSSKTAAEFAACSAAALGLAVRNDRGLIVIIRSNSLGVQVARWDFVATNTGSQAELRNGAKDGAGADAVRGCA